MLANGPPWTSAGEPSIVCTRFGLIASLSSAVIAPAACRCAGGDRLPVARVGDDDARQPLLEVGEVVGEAQDRHDLGRDRDVEAALAREAVAPAPDAPPRPTMTARRARSFMSTTRRQTIRRVSIAERVAPVDVVVDQRREQVVRRRDGVEVAGEVQVDALHRHHLRAAAAGRAALDAEHRAERRLAQRDHRLLADPVERVAEADRRRRLAFAGRRRVDRGDEHELAVGPAVEREQEVALELGDVLAVEVERIERDAGALGDLGDGTHAAGAGDGEVVRHGEGG